MKVTAKEADDLIKKYYELDRKYQSVKVKWAYAVIAVEEYNEKNSIASMDKYVPLHSAEFSAHSEFNQVQKEFLDFCDYMESVDVWP